jgi:hypothetical protein
LGETCGILEKSTGYSLSGVFISYERNKRALLLLAFMHPKPKSQGVHAQKHYRDILEKALILLVLLQPNLGEADPGGLGHARKNTTDRLSFESKFCWIK